LLTPSRDVRAILFAGEHGFFEAEPLSMDEVPHRPVIDFEAALGELGDEPAQSKIFFLDP
jgi:hypothetical protein